MPLADDFYKVARPILLIAFVTFAFSLVGHLALPLLVGLAAVKSKLDYWKQRQLIRARRRPQPSKAPVMQIEDYRGATQLTRLPPEVLIQVAELLSTRDLLSLERTCARLHDIVGDEDLWRAKIYADFKSRGLIYADDLRALAPQFPFRAIYAAMGQQWRFFCADDGWGLIWRDPRYWRVEPCPESQFGKTLNLRVVFWLHLFRNVHVAPGRYRAVWGLRVRRGSAHSFVNNSLATTDFLVHVDDETRLDEKGRPDRILVQKSQLGHGIVREISLDGGWFEVEFPVFEVPAGSSTGNEWRTLLVEIKETGGIPKSGLFLDYLRLDRSDDHAMPESELEEEEIHVTPYDERNSNLLRLSEKAVYSITSDDEIIAAYSANCNQRIEGQQWNFSDVVQALKVVINTFPESSGKVY
ncbi:uncharacterized protein V2V93DRAFT_364194 [Kockiozyma suomiensis]|uniref:uncharacterized protein n=1 Tax=Kockiozyma suomiensis TaxID=1337062 RepID=UPI003343F9B3